MSLTHCPHQTDITCDYLHREQEWQRQLREACKHNLPLHIFENSDCPVDANMCQILAAFKLKRKNTNVR